MRNFIMIGLIAAIGYLLYATGLIGPGKLSPPGEASADINAARAMPAPEPGDIVQLELNTGGIIQGQIVGVNRDNVVIDTEYGELEYAPSQLSTNSQKLVFGDDFSKLTPKELPHVIHDAKIIQHLLDGDETPESLGFGRNVQFVIMGEKAIFIYGH